MPVTYGNTIFCDDLREEIGGKKTFVGCYSDQIKFDGPNPNLLPTFVIYTTIMEPFEDAKAPMNVKVIYERDDLEEITLFDADLPIDRSLTVVKTDEHSMLASILSVKVSPMIFDVDGRIKVRGFRDAEIFRFGSIRIQSSPAEGRLNQPKSSVTE